MRNGHRWGTCGTRGRPWRAERRSGDPPDGRRTGLRYRRRAEAPPYPPSPLAMAGRQNGRRA